MLSVHTVPSHPRGHVGIVNCTDGPTLRAPQPEVAYGSRLRTVVGEDEREPKPEDGLALLGQPPRERNWRVINQPKTRRTSEAVPQARETDQHENAARYERPGHILDRRRLAFLS